MTRFIGAGNTWADPQFRSRGWALKCSACQTESHVISSPHGKMFPPHVLTRKFTAAGWFVGKKPRDDLCPACFVKSQQRRARPAEPSHAAASPRPPPRPAEKPRILEDERPPPREVVARASPTEIIKVLMSQIEKAELWENAGGKLKEFDDLLVAFHEKAQTRIELLRRARATESAPARPRDQGSVNRSLVDRVREQIRESR
jgi:hypothetical protein